MTLTLSDTLGMAPASPGAQSEPELRVVKQDTSLKVLDSWLGVGLCPLSRPPGPDLGLLKCNESVFWVGAL